MVDVVQHIQNDHRVAGRQRHLAHVAADEARAAGQVAHRGFGAGDVARHQLDAGVGAAHRRRRPAGGPAPGLGVDGGEQAGEQPLAAADVDDVRAGLQATTFQQAAEHRVAAQLAAGEMPGKAAGTPVRRAGGFMQRAPGGVGLGIARRHGGGGWQDG